MRNSVERLILAFAYSETDEVTPEIALRDASGALISAISTREPLPCLPLPNMSVGAVSAIDVLEHVHDEQAWLGELARVLIPGGGLMVRVPLENLMAWADALNMYSYAADVLGIETEPFETIPTGWHRHYTRDELPALLELAGFEITNVSTQGTPLLEFPHLAALLTSNVLGSEALQRRMGGLFEKLRAGPRLPLPASVASTVTIHATWAREGFRPDPDLNRTSRPEASGDMPLE